MGRHVVLLEGNILLQIANDVLGLRPRTRRSGLYHTWLPIFWALIDSMAMSGLSPVRSHEECL